MGQRNDPELRQLPAVHELAGELEREGISHTEAVSAARAVIAERRAALLARDSDKDGPGSDETQLSLRAQALVRDRRRRSLRPVLNATGVVIHTNLGRAPLPAPAQEAVAAAAGYLNLELDLPSGRRGQRQIHVESLLCELTGGEAALAVNNGAAAVLLATAALAGAGGAVIVSRGQLVEIGGGFRIPEVVAQSGARLIEVGTTNRTTLRDYTEALALAGETAVILRVHPSNFRTMGYVEDVPIEALCGLGVPVIDDVGSGVLGATEAMRVAGEEPAVSRSVRAGAALVCCSADKLLGGPQAGLLVGEQERVAAAAKHPLARALRIDKLSLAALEATLRLHLDPDSARESIPVLAMLATDPATLQHRAHRLHQAIGPERCEIVNTVSRTGGGSLPLKELNGPAVALAVGDPDAVAARLRTGDPAVLARVQEGRVWLDPRTLTEGELGAVAAAARRALEPS